MLPGCLPFRSTSPDVGQSSYRPDLAGIAKGLAQVPGKALDVLKGGGSGNGSNAKQLLKGLFGK